MSPPIIYIIPAIPRTPPQRSNAPPVSRWQFFQRYREYTAHPLRGRLEMTAEDITRYVKGWRHPHDLAEMPRYNYLFAKFRHTWDEIMTKRKDAPLPTFNRPEWKGFLELRLTEEELAICDDWQPAPTDVWEFVHRLCTAGYDISYSYNHNTKTATCTLKDQLHSRSTAGYAISSQDADIYNATKIAVYKHFTLLKEDWNSLKENAPRTKRG